MEMGEDLVYRREPHPMMCILQHGGEGFFLNLSLLLVGTILLHDSNEMIREYANCLDES